MQSKYSRGVLLCLVATVSWGGMFPVMNSALKHIDPFTFTCMRYAIAGIAFLIVLLAMEGREGLSLKGEKVGLAWFFGTAGFAGFQFLVFLGQDLVGDEGALIASIMMATMPLLGLLVNWVVRKVAPPKVAFGFIVLSFIGVTLVITKGHYSELITDPQDYGAQLLIILGALCWVIYTYGATFFTAWSPVKYTTITTVLGLGSAVAITAVLLATKAVAVPSGGNVVTILPELAYMSLVAGFIGVLGWNMGNKILTPLNGVLFMDVVPVTAFTVSALTGVVPAAMQIVGACLTAGALIGNNLYLRRNTPAPAPAKKQEEVAPAQEAPSAAAR